MIDANDERHSAASTTTPTAGSVRVNTWLSCVEVLRSPHVVSDVGGEIDRAHIRGGSVHRIDGPPHRQRRRALNALLRRDGHKRFRDTALFPTVARRLDEMLATPDPDGLVRADLVRFASDVNLQLAAAIVGIDRAESATDRADLLGILDGMAAVVRATVVEILDRPDVGAILPRALEAKERFRTEYYKPALARRRELAARVDAGTLPADQLPHDLLTLIATLVDPAWETAETALRDSLAVFRAAIRTSTQTLCSLVRELEAWTEAHPKDRGRQTDPAFLLQAVYETLRVSPPNARFVRRALDDFQLSDGTEIRKGDVIVVETGRASRDPTVFGANAAAFDPWRETSPTTYPYGLAFNAGPHMCFGLPIVLGNEGIDGSIVHIAARLFEHDVRIDPERSPQPRGRRGELPADEPPDYKEFHVVLRR